MSVRKPLVLALLAAASARAGGDSTTLFDSRPFIRDGAHQDNSIYEAFSLNARADGSDWLQDIRVVAGTEHFARTDADLEEGWAAGNG